MRPFIPNLDFGRELAEEDEYAEGLRVVAEDVRGRAEIYARQVGAPWMPRKGYSTVQVQEDEDGVYVANTDHGGHLMEYGSVNNPPHAPLRRGALSAGLRF